MGRHFTPLSLNFPVCKVAIEKAKSNTQMWYNITNWTLESKDQPVIGGKSCIIITCWWERTIDACTKLLLYSEYVSIGERRHPCSIESTFLMFSKHSTHTEAWGYNHCPRPLFKQFIHYLHPSAQVSKNNLTKALHLFQKDQGCGGLLLKPLNGENFFPWESETAQNVKLWSKLLTTFTSNSKAVISFCSHLQVWATIAKHRKTQT